MLKGTRAAHKRRLRANKKELKKRVALLTRPSSCPVRLRHILRADLSLGLVKTEQEHLPPDIPDKEIAEASISLSNAIIEFERDCVK